MLTKYMQIHFDLVTSDGYQFKHEIAELSVHRWLRIIVATLPWHLRVLRETLQLRETSTFLTFLDFFVTFWWSEATFGVRLM